MCVNARWPPRQHFTASWQRLTFLRLAPVRRGGGVCGGLPDSYTPHQEQKAWAEGRLWSNAGILFIIFSLFILMFFYFSSPNSLLIKLLLLLILFLTLTGHRQVFCLHRRRGVDWVGFELVTRQGSCLHFRLKCLTMAAVTRKTSNLQRTSKPCF